MAPTAEWCAYMTQHNRWDHRLDEALEQCRDTATYLAGIPINAWIGGIIFALLLVGIITGIITGFITTTHSRRSRR